MNPETKVENKAVDLIYKHLGIVSIKVKASGNNGYPDRMFFIPGGRPLFIEFKRPGEEPNKLQSYIINYLSESGYDVKVCDNEVDAFQSAIDAAVNAACTSDEYKVCNRAQLKCMEMWRRAGEKYRN